MSMNASKSFSRMLRQYRLTRHLTQEEMAERCCISTRHYCDLENGYVDPRLSTIAKICSAIGLRLPLFDDDAEPDDCAE